MAVANVVWSLNFSSLSRFVKLLSKCLWAYSFRHFNNQILPTFTPKFAPGLTQLLVALQSVFVWNRKHRHSTLGTQIEIDYSHY